MTKTRLQTPLEFIDLHFLFENVPRSFTHQLVRQRTAAYVQESQRFAVKEDASYGVSMPPSIEALPEDHPARVRWHNAVVFIGDEYLSLVNEGIPAEDARGLLPTDILTKVHYKTNLRNLVEHAGNRLCTQAQFEWRVVWAAMIAAIRARGAEQKRLSNRWEYDTIADIFRPICYFTGKCEFMAATDRYCSIRDRVENFHKAGVPSERWSDEKWGHPFTIRPQEWLLNPAAARTTSLHWRQEGTTS
jgi:flavin-dependent thymidylate synthase